LSESGLRSSDGGGGVGCWLSTLPGSSTALCGEGYRAHNWTRATPRNGPLHSYGSARGERLIRRYPSLSAYGTFVHVVSPLVAFPPAGEATGGSSCWQGTLLASSACYAPPSGGRAESRYSPHCPRHSARTSPFRGGGCARTSAQGCAHLVRLQSPMHSDTYNDSCLSEFT
jgi:hypothetical protein